MSQKFQRKITGLILGLCLFTSGLAWAEPQNDFVMVVHLSNDLTSISRQEAALIFLSKKRSWSDGKTITVIINEKPQIYSIFSQRILKRSTRQYLIFRKKMLFRGQGIPPQTVNTDQEVIDFVSNHRGGVGYISPKALTQAVKILAIAPEEPK